MARLSQGAEFMKLQIQPIDPPAGFGKYVVKDIFTTADGSWDMNGTIFSITSWARNGYLKPMGSPDYFDDAGGATHLFARVEDENGRAKALDVRFFTGNLAVAENTGQKKSGWANMFMNGDSAFYIEQGQRGPWSAIPLVPYAEAVTGLGLPNRWHVSTFVVWKWQPAQVVTPPIDPPVEPPVGGDVEKRLAWCEREIRQLKGLLKQWTGE
jgi:hypothetical protein